MAGDSCNATSGINRLPDVIACPSLLALASQHVIAISLFAAILIAVAVVACSVWRGGQGGVLQTLSGYAGGSPCRAFDSRLYFAPFRLLIFFHGFCVRVRWWRSRYFSYKQVPAHPDAFHEEDDLFELSESHEGEHTGRSSKRFSLGIPFCFSLDFYNLDSSVI